MAKFPLVTRARLVKVETRLGLTEDALKRAGADVERMKESLSAARAACYRKDEEAKGVQAEHDRTVKNLQQQLTGSQEDYALKCRDNLVAETEITRLTAAFEKLTADYNDLGKHLPAFSAKRVKWSGPGGARESIQKAIHDQSVEAKRARAEAGGPLEVSVLPQHIQPTEEGK